MEQRGQYRTKLFVLLTLFFAAACNNKEETKNSETAQSTLEKVSVAIPDFNADSAYSYVKAQVDFGPRVPGSEAHKKCAAYLVDKLKSYSFDVTVQQGVVKVFDGKQFNLKNIIATHNPESQNRILISSHWDTRPWADSDSKQKDKPFDGANDGASGVGVALEIARQLALQNPNVGVDIIFFDLEDYGQPGGAAETWCLGSQYWSKNLHKPNYYANFGVLLDMVGGENAIFPQEQHSVDMAGFAVEKIWKAAAKLGYGNHFVEKVENFVGVDDHIFVNNAGIPCVDIIEFNPSNGGFGFYHHTHDDNMNVINKNTLKAVGQTLLQVIYSE